MGIVARQSVRLSWPVSQALPGGSIFNIYRDGGSEPEAACPVPAWPDGNGKRGFGRGRFGSGKFGSSAGGGGFGFGSGRFGRGGFGVGEAVLEIQAADVPDAVHNWTVAASDPAGNESAAASAALAVAGSPEAPADLEASAYAEAALSLAFTLSGDDEG